MALVGAIGVASNRGRQRCTVWFCCTPKRIRGGRYKTADYLRTQSWPASRKEGSGEDKKGGVRTGVWLARHAQLGAKMSFDRGSAIDRRDAWLGAQSIRRSSRGTEGGREEGR